MGQTYSQDMERAARRHLMAGENLYGTHRKDVSGYLFGLAAECALKSLMIKSGMRPMTTRSKDDPFYAHLEELKSQISRQVSGRLQSQLLKYVDDQNFFKHWDITMRYSDGKDIKPEWIDRWRVSAQQVVSEMDLQ